MADITQIGTSTNVAFFYFSVCDNLRLAVKAPGE